MYILGISAFYHDSAAALLRDGDLVAAAQEERFSRTKFDHRFPEQAIEYCLSEAGITAGELDYVVFYEKPLPKFERILRSNLSTFPRSWKLFREAMIAWLGEKLWLKSIMLDKLPVPSDRILFVEHHLSHAASAMFCSPFEEAAVLTVDGVGEWTTTAMGKSTADWGKGLPNRIELTNEICFPHSLGLFYSAFTAWLGFRVNSGEYKVMGMAPYGQPRYMDKLKKVIKVYNDGSLRLNMDYFSFHYSPSQTFNKKFVELFGPPRKPESSFFTSTTGDDIKGREQEAEQNQYYADVAASVQRLTEETMLKMANHLHRQTGLKNLVMAGGVTLNSVANGRIMRETPFEHVYIQPNAGDAGGALGAALYAWHVLLGKPRRFVMEHAYYGKSYDDEEVRRALDGAGMDYEQFDDSERLADCVVEEILKGNVISLFQGRFEWGPRALGNRSIIADPRRADMKEIVNTKIKFREPFRPFAPVVTEESASRYFDLRDGQGQYPQRFMLMVSPVRPERQAEIPAVCHMGTGRLQVIRREDNPLYYDIVHRFGQATGVPVLMNTSFNLRGEPIVASPADALSTFSKSDLDMLVMGRFLVTKDRIEPSRSKPAAYAENAGSSSTIELELLESLTCPVCRNPLRCDPNTLNSTAAVCTECGKRFISDSGIPLLYWPTGETNLDSITDRMKEFYEENPFPGYEEVDNVQRLVEKARKGIFAKLLDDQIPGDAEVLEVGCGTGQLSNFLAARGRKVFGADICVNSLKLGKRFSVENNLDTVSFVQMNLFRPVFRNHSFDFVICNGVLHHTDDPFAGFRSISQLVRLGGYVVIGLYNRFGRVWTDMRRAAFRISGNRFQFLDPYMARADIDDSKKRIWFADQYVNPHESKHTIGQLLGWFDETGFEFVNSIPKPYPFGKLRQYESLFEKNARGSRFGHLLAQIRLALASNNEGGFFVMIGKKTGCGVIRGIARELEPAGSESKSLMYSFQ